MAAYYLVSQLPSLDGIGENAPLPITEERFMELCRRFLGNKALEKLESLSLLPPRDCPEAGAGLPEQWSSNERDLRLALAKVRAEKMKKPFDAGNRILPAALLRVASAALEQENPMEAERLLDRHRLEFLETLRPMDSFSEDYLFYYRLRLGLLLRVRQFDAAAGEEAYRNLYHSILSGDTSEATI